MQPCGTKSANPIGHQTVKITPVSKDFCQESLTKLPKLILNRDTYLIPSFMGLNNIGTRLVAATSLALATPACAQDAAEATQTAERDAVVQVTREQCLAIADRDGKIACLRELRVQREAEIAALDEAERAQGAEIAALDGQIAQQNETIADVREERAEVNTDIEVLTEEARIARAELEGRILGPQQ